MIDIVLHLGKWEESMSMGAHAQDLGIRMLVHFFLVLGVKWSCGRENPSQVSVEAMVPAGNRAERLAPMFNVEKHTAHVGDVVVIFETHERSSAIKLHPGQQYQVRMRVCVPESVYCVSGGGVGGVYEWARTLVVMPTYIHTRVSFCAARHHTMECLRFSLHR